MRGRCTSTMSPLKNLISATTALIITTQFLTYLFSFICTLYFYLAITAINSCYLFLVTYYFALHNYHLLSLLNRYISIYLIKFLFYISFLHSFTTRNYFFTTNPIQRLRSFFTHNNYSCRF